MREVDAHPAAFSRVRLLRLRSAPMLLLAVCFAAGILCRWWWQPAAEMVIMCVLLLLVATVARRRAPRMAWLAVGAVWVALGWTAAVLEPQSQDNTLLHHADELQRSVAARVVAIRPLQAPVADDATEDETRFAARGPVRHAVASVDLDVTAVEEMTPDKAWMEPVRGGARITLMTKADTFSMPPCGAMVSVVVRMRPPQRFIDPGVFQYAEVLEARGIGVQGTADAASLHVLDGSHTTWACRFAGAQQWASTRMQQLGDAAAWRALPRMLRLSQADAAMLSAMLFGDRTRLTGELRVAFERTGSFHLFVVAGMHVALLIAFLYGALTKLKTPAWIAAAIALAVACAFAMLTGFGAPVQRALGMSAVYLPTRLLARDRSTLNALGAAALAMLVLHPGALFEAGFQMTVFVVVAIGGIAWPLWQRTLSPYEHALRDIHVQAMDAHLQPRYAQLRVSVRWVGSLLASRDSQSGGKRVSPPLVTRAPAAAVRGLLLAVELAVVALCAEVVMALPMAVYFHRATPFGIPANLLAVPVVGLLMGSAVATFITALMHPLLAVLFGSVTAALLHGVTAIIGAISSLRGADVRMPAPLLVLSIATVVCWCGATYLLSASPARAGRIACLLLPMSLACVLWPRAPRLTRDALEFTALDVGQGDSLFVASPLGQTMLIDAGGPVGPASLTAANFDLGEEVVSPYLWTRGLRRLDVAVLTHAHSDHIGGMLAVLRNFRPRELWVSADAATPAYHALLQEAATQGMRVRRLRAGETQAWGGTSIQVLSPQSAYQTQTEPVNDDSLALRIAYDKGSVLAEGDAEGFSEGTMLVHGLAPVTLLKVGHHGSNTSTAEAFLQAVHPRAAVISCGRGNHFGHPRRQVLQRLQGGGVLTSRTDTMGAVRYLLRADGSLQTQVLSQP